MQLSFLCFWRQKLLVYIMCVVTVVAASTREDGDMLSGEAESLKLLVELEDILKLFTSKQHVPLIPVA